MRFVGILASLYLALFPAVAWALVNINTASVAELDTLPYVGTSTAELIIAGRPYSSISDIQRISGFGGGPGSRNYDAVIGLIAVSGATTVVVTETEGSNSGNVKTITATPGESSKSPMVGLTIEAPEFAHVNQPVTFEVKHEDGRTRAARYVWNFGDGTSEAITSPTHAYARPGTYVVVVEGYYMKEFLTARLSLRVLPVSLSVVEEGSDVVITNDGAEEIDLSGMSLRGRGEFTFPKHSILLPGSSLTIPLAGVGSVAVFDGAGKVAARAGGQAAGAKPPPLPPPTPKAAPVITANSAAAAAPPPVQGPVLPEPVSNLAAASAATLPDQNFWPYLGLAGLILMGFLGLWSGRSADRGL